MTTYQDHVKQWSSCRRCPLWQTRNKVVLCRGRLPCDVLFVGEAPGKSEDVLGQPFVGPAGQLIDRIVERALLPWQTPGTVGLKYNSVTVAFSNLIACIPIGDDGSKTEEPDDRSVSACAPRLTELVEMAQPKLLVAVGSVARDYLQPGYFKSIPVSKSIYRIDIVHPAFILRAPWASRDLQVKGCIVKIKEAVERFVIGQESEPCQNSTESGRTEPRSENKPKYQGQTIHSPSQPGRILRGAPPPESEEDIPF